MECHEAEELENLAKKWMRISINAKKDGEFESSEYLRAKAAAYFNCSSELADAIGRPIPMPPRLLTERQISEALTAHQKKPLSHDLVFDL